METLWIRGQGTHLQYTEEVPVELDQDLNSEPGSVPLPNEDFEPFYGEYVHYDEQLEHSLGQVQELGIPESDPYSQYHAQSEGDLTITGPGKPSNSYTPLHDTWSSPIKPSSHMNAFQDCPPVPVFDPLETPVTASSSQFLSPSPERQSRFDWSPRQRPPGFDNLPSSPPGSPLAASHSFRWSRSENQLGSADSLGIHSIKLEDDSTTLKSPPPPVFGSPTSAEKLAWQPILTIPVEAQKESEQIIRSQRSTTDLRGKRKSCLPPGTVDEYIAGPKDGIYECLYPHCGRLFRRKYNLKSHIQTHLCDRPHVCEHCEATFVRPHDLKRHELCHKSTRQFVCPCGKSFTRMDAMQRHRARQICEGAIDGTPSSSPRRKRTSKKNARSPASESSGSDYSSPDS